MPIYHSQRQEETCRDLNRHGYYFARNGDNRDVVLTQPSTGWEVAVYPSGRFAEI